MAEADEAFLNGRFSSALGQYERLLYLEGDCDPRFRFRSAVQAAMCVSRLGRHEEGTLRFEALYDSFVEEMNEANAYKHAVAMMVQLDVSEVDGQQLADFADFVGARHKEQGEKFADFAERLSRRSRRVPPGLDTVEVRELAILWGPVRFLAAIEESASGVTEGQPWLLFLFRRESDGRIVKKVTVTDRSAIDIELPEVGNMFLDVLVGGEVPFVTAFRFRAKLGSEEIHVLTPDVKAPVDQESGG